LLNGIAILVVFLFKQIVKKLMDNNTTVSTCRLAIISPSNNAYSETFIQQHRKLSEHVFFYYGGFFPKYLEQSGKVFHQGIKFLLYNILKKFRKKSALNFLETSLANSFKKNKIQIVLAEYGPTAVEILRVCKKLNIPMVVHFHGFDASENEILNKYSSGYKNVFQYASAVIVVSNQMRKKIESLSCPPKKIKLIPYGPAEEYYEVVPICKDKQFVAVGRFVEKKAPYLTMAAFQKVLQYYPGAKLIMIGDGKLLPVCEHLSKVWHMESNISFTGALQPTEIKKIFSQSIAFVQHSITASTGDMEGTPVAILEAAAASLPVISTNHAGIGDVIINNETGFLVDEFDVEAMANHMKSILDYPEKAREMGIKNKKNISENYTLENHLNQLRNTFNEIIVS